MSLQANRYTLLPIQFRVEIDDLIAFNRYHLRASKTATLLYRLGYVYGMIIAVVLALLASRWHVWARVVLALGFLAVWIPGYWMFSRWWVGFTVRKFTGEGRNKGILGAHTIVLSAEGLTETSEVGETRTTWQGVERIAESDSHIFLYIGAYQAHTIPKRAFPSAHDAAEFVRVARVYSSGGRA